MATANQIDAVERLISTHQISREDVVRAVGPFEDLTGDQVKALILSLVDGEFGGVTSRGYEREYIHPFQMAIIYGQSSKLWGKGFVPPLKDFIAQVYPDFGGETKRLTRRQAAKLIILLDREIERGRHAANAVGISEAQAGA